MLVTINAPFLGTPFHAILEMQFFSTHVASQNLCKEEIGNNVCRSLTSGSYRESSRWLRFILFSHIWEKKKNTVSRHYEYTILVQLLNVSNCDSVHGNSSQVNVFTNCSLWNVKYWYSTSQSQSHWTLAWISVVMVTHTIETGCWQKWNFYFWKRRHS